MKSNLTSVTNRDITYSNVVDKLPCSRKKIYEVLKNNPTGLTTKQLVEKMGIPINRISGRITELQTAGLVQGVKTNIHMQTRCPNTVWMALTDPIKIELNQDTKITEKKWRKAKKIYKAIEDDIRSNLKLDHEILEKLAKLI